jgi:hypothetical protein
MVCGKGLTYLEKSEPLRCIYCGRTEEGHIACPEGHYICDHCHNQDAMRMIEDVAFTTTSKDPIEIAELMMSFPGLPMLGCHHAYIAGGALMAAIKNEGSRGLTNDDIKEVFRRTKRQAHGGYCGLTGVCGIAPAVGAVFAVLTGSKCGKDGEQRITMEAVTRVARAITELTGPSCCKAYVWTSLDAALDCLRETLSVDLTSGGKRRCSFGPRHPHGCRTKRCPYFNGDITFKDSGNESEDNKTCHSAVLQKDISGEEGMEYLLDQALELGAEKARVIDTDTIVVEEWVRWKCQYGCPLYEKDGFHPPCAPAAESTRKVVKEYSKAILMNGPKGKALTEVAVKLEGIAYHRGYYKAFALTALSSGPPGST